MAKLPGLPSWSMYAGGTGAAPGKHSYDIRQDGKQYMISPFTTKYGRHAGYILNVFPGTNHGYQGITPVGNPVLYPVIEVRYIGPPKGTEAKVIDKLPYQKAKDKMTRMKKRYPDRSYRLGDMFWSDK